MAWWSRSSAARVPGDPPEPTRVHGAVRRGPVWALGAVVLAAVFAAQLATTPVHRLLQLDLFDAYQALWPRSRQSAPVVIVAIDEASLERHGQWPWPRWLLGRLVEAIAAAQPAAIGLDLLFPEPDRHSPARLAEYAPHITEGLAQELRRLPSNDALFAAALKDKPVVLAVAGVDEGVASPRVGRMAPFVIQGTDPLPKVRKYSGALRSVEMIDRAAAGHGLISADLQRGVVRRVPLVSAIRETLAPALSLEMIRVASGTPALRVRSGRGGVESVGTGGVMVPTDAEGHAWVRYSRHDPTRFLSAADVLDGRVAAAQLERRLVLVGLTGLGLVDYPATPVDSRVPGVEVHAQLLENIFDGTHLIRPNWGPALEAGLLFSCGLLLVALAPVVRPWLALLIAAAVAAAMFAAGGFAFLFTGMLIDTASPAAGGIAVFGVALGATLVESERQRRRLRAELQTQREAAARLAGELEAARRVQMGMLPDPASVLANDARLDLAAFMEPAREVGGDLYDFYRLTDDRLLFLVGDVSGKGLPASLMMAVSKSVCKGVALRGIASVDALLARANAEIARDNPDFMFVTALACALDLNTGVLEYCSAGHEAACVLRAGGGVLVLEEGGGPPLCMLDDYRYEVGRHALAPGETIVLVTDGITEAMDAGGALYGRARFRALLAGLAAEASAASVIAAIRRDIATFCAGAEPMDDMTALALRWNGPARSRS